MFLHKSIAPFRWIYPELIWRIPTNSKILFLTFDDGPIPEITEFVLNTLAQFQARATFFCIGHNIEKYPLIFEKIIQQKHRIGNHTFNHFDGWKTDDYAYLENFQKTDAAINNRCYGIQESFASQALFRPPYGHIKKSQASEILKTHQIIMWDVLSGDFSPEISPQKCLYKTIQHSQTGSIIVFHDSTKAYKNMTYTLPRFLEYFTEKGFEFEVLP